LASKVFDLLAPQLIVKPLEVIFLLFSGLFFLKLFLEKLLTPLALLLLEDMLTLLLLLELL
jgi:hypothetical protein